MLMVLYYQNYAVPCIDHILKEDDEVDDNNKKSLRKFIISMFEITKDEKGFLTTEITGTQLLMSKIMIFLPKNNC